MILCVCEAARPEKSTKAQGTATVILKLRKHTDDENL